MVKKICLFLSFCIIAHASDYFPLKVSNYWLYEVTNYSGISKMKWEIISDTTISNVQHYKFEVTYYDDQGITIAEIYKVLYDFERDFVYLDTLVPAHEFYIDTSLDILDTIHNYSFNNETYSNVQRRTFFADPYGEHFQTNFNIDSIGVVEREGGERIYKHGLKLIAWKTQYSSSAIKQEFISNKNLYALAHKYQSCNLYFYNAKGQLFKQMKNFSINNYKKLNTIRDISSGFFFISIKPVEQPSLNQHNREKIIRLRNIQ